jgi:molecular chaperone GrpE
MTWRIYRHPSESEGNKAAPNGENDMTVESIASPMDPMAQMQADINASKAEVAEWQDRFLRKAAELENYRKRAEKEKADSMILAKSAVLLEFLPVADACERALNVLNEARSAPGDLQQYQEGVELLYRQVLDALGRTGATPIKAEGTQFDPHLHEALSREETPDCQEGTVVKELRRGYLFRDKLLRPSQVVVAVYPQGKDQSSQ